MVRYRCIGWGTTNGSGVATLDYDADGNQLLTSGYTGQGVGLVDFVASAENPSAINSSSDVSNTYPVTDCSFYDKATNETGAKNYYWRNNDGWTVELTENGTHITERGNSEYMPSTVENGKLWNTRRLFDVDIAVEFDIHSVVNYPRFLIYYNSTNVNFAISETGHYKVEIKSDGITKTFNGTSSSITGDTITSQVCFGFQDSNVSTIGELTFHDFKVYPI